MSLVRNIFTTAIGNEARKMGKGNGLLNFGLGLLAARVATRSVPGALLVGGALVAKTLYDRSREAEEIPASEAVIDIEGKPVPKDDVKS
ncbi:hypothetical protein SAMN02745824_1684 [Parasphingorhabdus marina DSM 22363]|uniref:Uncharacterized protein n=1 Tax=Parasphingorhabdus marina DSM 22363 TaxID=1123272 RepID=A0A1N6D8C7_9SPHN|nr:hypothetical protein [Parasphingorhabdus marina]SIN67039.1 hypothetical protein SAMN02745824_1684 [Parasphingorhabdus marina DSM 22363]